MLVVFDLDGTLIDSRRDLADAANALIVEHGGQPLPVERISRMVGEGAALLVRRALAAAGLAEDTPGALPRFLDLYSERLLVHTRLYDGAEEVIAILRRQARLAILTNKPLKATEKSSDTVSRLDDATGAPQPGCEDVPHHHDVPAENREKPLADGVVGL